MDITKLMSVFNFSLLLVFLVFYERHKNNERLKNPFYKMIERILSKYYSGYFLRFNDLKYYPKLKLIYSDLICQLYNEGIYQETLESYVKSKEKSTFTLMSFLTLLGAYLGGLQLENLISIINILKEKIYEIIPSFSNDILISLLIVLLLMFGLFAIFTLILYGSNSIVEKYSLKKQGKRIIKDVLEFSKNNKGITKNLNSDNIIFTDQNIYFLDIRIIRTKKKYIIYFPKEVISSLGKSEWVIEHLDDVIGIPHIILNNNEYVFVFKKSADKLSINLNKINPVAAYPISEMDLQKLRIIFQILFLGADMEYSRQNFVLRWLNSIVSISKTNGRGAKARTIFASIILFVLFMGVFGLIIFILPFFGTWYFYILLLFFILFYLALIFVKKMFS